MVAEHGGSGLIHERATATSLGLLRVWIFGLLALIPLLERTWTLTSLPLSAFSPPGVMGLIPDAIWSRVFSPLGFGLILTLVIGGCIIVCSGLIPSRGFALTVSALVLFEQGIARGFSGHVNHAELVLVYSAVILSFFPIYDALSVRKTTPRPGGSAISYRMPFILIMILFTFSYSFAGAARISEGIDVFTSDTLRNLMLSEWMESAGNVPRDTLIVTLLSVTPPIVIRMVYLLTTLGELLAPIALWNRQLRLTFVAFALAFHIVNLILLDVTFFENIALLVVFSEVWFHHLAGALQRLAASTNQPEVVAS